MVLLPDALDPFNASLAFLSTRTSVDLRAGLDDPAGRRELLWAITGVRTADSPGAGADGDRCPLHRLAPQVDPVPRVSCLDARVRESAYHRSQSETWARRASFY